jgi:hypothetical protein
MPTILSVPAACAELGGISRTTLWTLVRDRHLEQVHIGRRAFITAESIAAYVDSLGGSADDDSPAPVLEGTVPRRRAEHRTEATVRSASAARSASGKRLLT